MILDSHLHVWDTSEVGVSWLAEAGLPATACIPDAPEGRQYILVEADADDPAREANWLSAVAAEDQRVHGIVACVALENADATGELKRIAAIPQVVGVRRLLQDRDLFQSPGLLHGLRQLARHGLPFDACVRAHEIPDLIRLLEHVPELTVVLDHMGKPEPGSRQVMRDWCQNIARFAELPNACCKLSGLPAECRDTAELEGAVADIIGIAMDHFGPRRCLLGSDQPVSRDVHDWCGRVLSLLPESDQEDVASKNALRIYPRRQ